MAFCMDAQHSILLNSIAEYRVEIVKLKVELEYQQKLIDLERKKVERAEQELEFLRKDKQELLDYLMVASGVKQTELQKKLLENELSRADASPSYRGQGRDWGFTETINASKEWQKEKETTLADMIAKLENDGLSDK